MGRCYTEKTVYLNASGRYFLDPQCNGYVAVNIGDTIAQVNNKQIKPPPAVTLSGESVGIIGNADEIFTGTKGVIPIIFLPPVGANPLVMITEKFYL